MHHKWLSAWLIQIAEMLAVGALAALCEGVGGAIRGLALWVLVPAAGLATSCRAVGRGLNNYLAWLAPAPCFWAMNRLIWGYSPPTGPALLTAFAALVGAAAGEVLKQRAASPRHNKKPRS